MGLIRSLFASRDEDCPANESEAGCAEDAIASHIAPSSQAMPPRWSSVLSPATPEKQQDYEHQAVGVMLSCNELSLNYAITTQEILNIYAKHWNIEVFFRSCKQNRLWQVPALQETRRYEDVANSFTSPLSVLYSFRVCRLIRWRMQLFQESCFTRDFPQNALSA